MFAMPAHIAQASAAAYMATKRARTDIEHIRSVVVEFDAFDGKGRRHGYRVSIGKKTYTRDDSAHALVDDENLGLWFTARPQALKDGKTFGACQSAKSFRTLAEAEAAAAAMIERARKAATKKN